MQQILFLYFFLSFCCVIFCVCQVACSKWINEWMTHGNPASVDIVGSLLLFCRLQCHSAHVVRLDVGVSVLRSVARKVRVVPRLISPNLFQVLQNTTLKQISHIVSRTRTNFGDRAFSAAGPQTARFVIRSFLTVDRDILKNTFVQWDHIELENPHFDCASEIYLLTY